MKALERLILAAGIGTIVYLVWRFDPRVVWGMISQVGLAGFLLIACFQICDHLLNALGWRLSFSAQDAHRVPLWLLVKARIAGDGVNYLTPSGQIAGELIRPGMLGSRVPDDVKNGSVVVAKFSQAMAQALFIVAGMIFVLQGKLDFLEGRQRVFGMGASLVIFGAISFGIWVLTGDLEIPWIDKRFEGLAGIRAQMRGYLHRHPVRYCFSVLFFMAGYAWGGFECLLITHFMGMRLSVATAFAVEILSNVIDSIMFMVPAKMGTQEAGKTAIFHGLGYAASTGLAFGLIRHVREFLWACLGFAMYAVSRKKGAVPPARPPSAPGPLARAG